MILRYQNNFANGLHQECVLNPGVRHISSSYAKILGERLFRTWEIPRSGSKAKNGENTPGTAGGPGSRDRTLAVKSRKTAEKSFFFRKKNEMNPPKNIFFAYIFYLCQNIGGNKFSALRVSPKWVKSKRQKREREEKKKRAKEAITMAN